MKIDRTCDKLREECAVFGVSYAGQEAAGIAYNALLAMQHRGQEGSGIAVHHGNTLVCIKDTGLVVEAFENRMGEFPPSGVAIGHNRYSTTGNNTAKNVQPFLTEYLTGRIATAHNGNITNAKAIRDHLVGLGIHFDATSDSEVISALIAYCAMRSGDLVRGVVEAANRLEGSFSLAVAAGDGRLIAVRDGTGYRPLCLGACEGGIAVASESCALDSCGFAFLRDVRPGEVVLIEDGAIAYSGIDVNHVDSKGGLCIFEYIYFARPDSVIDGLSVYEARYHMGEILADEHPVDADIVCGVPDSGLEAAIGYAARSGIPLTTGFVKNRYIGRSFIYPTQSSRENAVRLKLNPLAANVRGKRIVLVDDSIVRGTTMPRIIKSLRDAGALEVHVRISSPPFRYACNYGTDIDAPETLIANQMTNEQICDMIGADSLGYISIKGLKTACGKSDLAFCKKCFAGNDSHLRKNDLEG